MYLVKHCAVRYILKDLDINLTDFSENCLSLGTDEFNPNISWQKAPQTERTCITEEKETDNCKFSISDLDTELRNIRHLGLNK